jgi:hypothetical protein
VIYRTYRNALMGETLVISLKAKGNELEKRNKQILEKLSAGTAELHEERTTREQLETQAKELADEQEAAHMYVTTTTAGRN